MPKHDPPGRHGERTKAAIAERQKFLQPSSTWPSSRSPCAILVWWRHIEGRQHLDSEQFRSAPRISRPLCGRLRCGNRPDGVSRRADSASGRVPMLDMKRREFISLLGGAAAAWPLTARAQQPRKLPTIGFVGSDSPDLYVDRLRAFRLGLKSTGFVEGQNVAVEYLWA